jgi:hypothetical protein
MQVGVIVALENVVEIKALQYISVELLNFAGQFIPAITHWKLNHVGFFVYGRFTSYKKYCLNIRWKTTQPSLAHCPKPLSVLLA